MVLWTLLEMLSGKAYIYTYKNSLQSYLQVVTVLIRNFLYYCSYTFALFMTLRDRLANLTILCHQGSLPVFRKQQQTVHYNRPLISCLCIEPVSFNSDSVEQFFRVIFGDLHIVVTCLTHHFTWTQQIY